MAKGKVVFQLPRGNLEGIYPKVIVIGEVGRLVGKRKYRAAFELIRTHKLDFNLLCDIDPVGFTENIAAVLGDI